MLDDRVYRRILTTSSRFAWALDDVLGEAQQFELACPLLPESLARTDKLGMLAPDERRLLNQLAAADYCTIQRDLDRAGANYMLIHALPSLGKDLWATRALLTVAAEKTKHIQLFDRASAALTSLRTGEDHSRNCEDLAFNGPLLIAMTSYGAQVHALAASNDHEIEPCFRSLLRQHWLEETQHARLARMIAEATNSRAIAAALFTDISALDCILRTQAEMRVGALEKVIQARLSDRHALIEQQHQAARWTHIGCALANPRFLELIETLAPSAYDRIAEEAPMFA